MCKVLIIPAIKKHKIKETMTFVRAMGASMSKGNSDGLGYAAINEQGDLFGERWFINQEAFRPVSPVKLPDYTPLKESAAQSVAQFGKALKSYKSDGWAKQPEVPRYNKFGNDNIENAVAITLHTRLATCDKNLVNVHPFVNVEHDTSVIHNGVIHNQKEFDLKLSTCDSESILISYLNNGVNKDIAAVQGMVDQLKGYYACGVFSRDENGERILDVFKFNNNNLSIAYIYELETYVLTSSDFELKEICRNLGFAHDGTQDVHDDYITRINPFTGDVVAQVAFAKPVVTTPSTYSGYNRQSWEGFEEWDNATQSYKKKADPTDGGGSTKTDHRGRMMQKYIDNHMARMMALKSSIREFGDREVEELAAGWGDK